MVALPGKACISLVMDSSVTTATQHELHAQLEDWFSGAQLSALPSLVIIAYTLLANSGVLLLTMVLRGCLEGVDVRLELS